MLGFTDSKPASASVQVSKALCCYPGPERDGVSGDVRAGSYTAGEEHGNLVALFISIVRKEPAATAPGLLSNCVSEDLGLL